MVGSQMVESIDDLTRRLCLLYPWSRECQGVPPIEPSPGEAAGMWHGQGGYQVATTVKNIPKGSQCESVQLIPVEAIGKRFGPTPVGNEVQLPSALHMQFPVAKSGLEMAVMHALFANPALARSKIINKNFL